MDIKRLRSILRELAMSASRDIRKSRDAGLFDEVPFIEVERDTLLRVISIIDNDGAESRDP